MQAGFFFLFPEIRADCESSFLSGFVDSAFYIVHFLWAFEVGHSDEKRGLGNQFRIFPHHSEGVGKAPPRSPGRGGRAAIRPERCCFWN